MRDLPKTLVRGIGVLALLVAIAAGVTSYAGMQLEKLIPTRACFPEAIRQPVLAMELPRSPADVECIVGEVADPRRAAMRFAVQTDFAFIAAYGLFFLAVAGLLASRPRHWAPYLGILGGGLGAAAASLDVAENLGILHALRLPLVALLQPEVTAIRDASLGKWTLSFMAVAVLSLAFEGLGWRRTTWIHVLFALSALVGFAGVFRHALLVLSFGPLLAGIILVAVVALASPAKLLNPPPSKDA